MFKIERPIIFSEVVHSLEQYSVVMTGPPGIGKSWLLASVAEHFKNAKFRSLVLASENYDVASPEELRQRLGLPTDIPSFLRSLGDKALLLIDGLDALRSESSAGAFRQLIGEVRERAPECKILVTIRTFDLEQSHKLQSLFSRGGFKTIEVAELTDSELASACVQSPQLVSLLKSARPPLLKLLRNPFMLRLALSLILDGISYESISQYTSEVQLLSRFWNRRIETSDHAQTRRWLLRIVAQIMSETKLLSVSVPDVLSRLDSDRRSEVFERLQSDEILREQTDRVMFGHNILFDYAASRLVLTLESIIPTMRDDPSRSIFLRPSIAYFFTTLWVFQRGQFWEMFERLADPDRGFQERLCIIPASVVVGNLVDSSELDSLRTWTQDKQLRALRSILRGVTNNAFASHDKRAIWSKVLMQSLESMDGDLVNEMIRLIALLSEYSSRRERESVARIARGLLYWAWREADRMDSRCDPVTLTTVVTGRLLPVILENYNSAPDESRQIVRRLLRHFGVESSSPKNAMYIAWGFKHVVDADPDTAEEIVRAIYSYEETSSERTQIGNSPIMPFTSTRKQDYDQAHYVLQRHFPYFVENAPLHALRASLAAVNEEVRREHLTNRSETETFPFSYNGILAQFKADWSEIWDQGHRDISSLSLLDTCLRSLIGDDKQTDITPKDVLTTIATFTDLAVTWRHVFSPFLSVSIETIDAIVPLLEDPTFLSAPEITRPIGSYIEKIYRQAAPTESQRRRIESAVLALGQSESKVHRYEEMVDTRNRLLTRIPAGDVIGPEAKALRQSLITQEGNLHNRPQFQSTFGAVDMSNESFLELRGIDTKNPRSRELLDALEPIRSFSSRFVNSIPDSTEVASILGNLSNAWEVLQKEKSEGEIGSNAAGTIAACAAAISKSDEIVINAEAAKLCKQILLSLSSHSQPEPRPEADESFDHPGWGAPLARIEVAEGLMSYAAKFPDDLEILDTIRRLSRDPVPAVRFQIAIRLAFFFKQKRSVLKELLTAMIASEKTAGVLGGLTQTINRIAYADPNLAVTLSRQIIEAPDYPRTIEKFGLDFLLVTLLQLDVFSHNEGSHALLMQMLDDTEKNVGAMIQMAHHVRQILELDSISEQDSDRGLFWLREIVHQSNRSLDSRRINGQSSTELISSLLKGLETVAFQIMILLDVDPNLRNAKQPLDESERRVEYGRMEPILSELVLGRGDRLYVTPPTALNLLKIFTKCLSFSPRKILHMAVETVSAGARFGFHYDQMAIDEFVEFAKVFLADNRDLLREQEAAKQFSDLLDIFARVGWPQAVQMVTTLDEALR